MRADWLERSLGGRRCVVVADQSQVRGWHCRHISTPDDDWNR